MEQQPGIHGEETPDETAEPRNRRIDYFLSFDPPALPSGSVAFSWKAL